VTFRKDTERLLFKKTPFGYIACFGEGQDFRPRFPSLASSLIPPLAGSFAAFDAQQGRLRLPGMVLR
jgi:hypothetical protein